MNKNIHQWSINIWRPIPGPWFNLTEVKKTYPVTKFERWFDMSYLWYCWDHSDALTCQIFDTVGNTDFLEFETAWVVRVLVVGTAWRWSSWLCTLATCRVRNLEKSMLHLQWLQEENKPETRMTRRPCHGLLRWNYQWTWTWAQQLDSEWSVSREKNFNIFFLYSGENINVHDRGLIQVGAVWSLMSRFNNNVFFYSTWNGIQS